MDFKKDYEFEDWTPDLPTAAGTGKKPSASPSAAGTSASGKKDDGFDFDEFLGPSLEDRLTAALGGRDLRLDDPTESPYVPKYPADPNHGRHENGTDDAQPDTDDNDPRFDAPRRPRVVVQDPEQAPVYVTRPVGSDPVRTRGGSTGGGPSAPDPDYDTGSRSGMGTVGKLLLAIVGLVAAIGIILLAANLLKGGLNSSDDAAQPSASAGTFILATSPTPTADSAANTDEAAAAPTQNILTAYSIQVTDGQHGDIIPSGLQSVREGESITFTVVPDEGYVISQVLVDGYEVQLSSSNSYTFSNVTDNHTIYAVFEKPATPTPAPTAVPTQQPAIVVTAEPTPTPEITPEPTPEPTAPPQAEDDHGEEMPDDGNGGLPPEMDPNADTAG